MTYRAKTDKYIGKAEPENWLDLFDPVPPLPTGTATTAAQDATVAASQPPGGCNPTGVTPNDATASPYRSTGDAAAASVAPGVAGLLAPGGVLSIGCAAIGYGRVQHYWLEAPMRNKDGRVFVRLMDKPQVKPSIRTTKYVGMIVFNDGVPKFRLTEKSKFARNTIEEMTIRIVVKLIAAGADLDSWTVGRKEIG